MKKSFDLAEAVNMVKNGRDVFCVIFTFSDSSCSFDFFLFFFLAYEFAINKFLNFNDDDLHKIISIRIDSYNKNALFSDGHEYYFAKECALRSMSIL